MIRLLKDAIHRFGRRYGSYIVEDEFNSQSFRRINERPIEYAFVFESILKTGPKTVLDVGTGTSALPSLIRTCGPLVTAIDNIRDYWPEGMVNRHFHVKNEDATQHISGLYDMVTCISVLEHIPAHVEAVRNMLDALNPGGHLVLTFPYNENRYVENAYALPDAGYGQDLTFVCQIYSRNELNQWLSGIAEIVCQNYWRMFSGPFWTVGESLRQPLQTTANDLHQLTCVLIRKLK